MYIYIYTYVYIHCILSLPSHLCPSYPFPVESGGNFVIGVISTKVTSISTIIMKSFKNVSFSTFVSDHLTMKKDYTFKDVLETIISLYTYLSQHSIHSSSVVVK